MKKITVNRLLILIVVLGLVFLLSTETQAGTAYTFYVPMVQKGHTIHLGTATYSGFLKDTLYEQVLEQTFNTVAPEVGGTYVHVYGGELYPAQGWDDMDYIADYADYHHLRLIYHNLRWWYPANDATAHPNTWTEISAWITEAMTRYPQITDWIVVNEGYDRLGNETVPYVAESYQLARMISPTATLWYNGLFIEPAEQAAVLALIDAGYVDKVGVQGHFDLNSNLSILDNFLHELDARGITWEITELDITIPGNDAYWLNRQAEKYSEVYRFALEHNALAITFWEFTDKYNWLSNGDLYTLYASPFDANISPKPAWFVFDSGDY